jgi:hypothetical protein
VACVPLVGGTAKVIGRTRAVRADANLVQIWAMDRSARLSLSESVTPLGVRTRCSRMI